MTASPTARRSKRRLVQRRGVAALVAIGAVGLVLAAAPTAGAQAGSGWIRFGHFAPANGPVRVAVDGKALTANAAFETVTPYRSEADGTHTVTLTDVDAPHTVWRDRVTVTTGSAVTVGAIQVSGRTELRSFADDLAAGPAGDARIRIIDTAPLAPQLRVTLEPTTAKTATDTASESSTPSSAAAAGVSLATPVVAFGTSSPYENVAAGRYTVVVTGADGRQILTGRDWPVTAGTVASVVVIQAKGQPTLEVLRDAAGSADAPIGGMQTGFGGAAGLLAGGHHSDDALVLELLGGLVAAAVLGVVTGEIARRHGRGRRRPVLAAVIVVVVATATGPAVIGARHSAPVAVPTTAPITVTPVAESPTSTPFTAPPPVVSGRRVAASTINLSSAATGSTGVAPRSLTISSIGVKTSLIKLGRTASGAAQVPTTTAVAGWYADGPAPGQPGPAVILGHVDSYKGPGIFFGLHNLKPGATIRIGEAGRSLTFVVQQVRAYPKTSFPTAAVFGPTPDRALRLVTCGGSFDHATGHYVDNVVVFATEVGGTSAG